MRKHGYSKRRTGSSYTWGLDESTGFIHAHTLTGNDKNDASQLEPLLYQVEGEIEKLSGDGAYDQDKCWSLLEKRSIKGSFHQEITQYTA